MAHDAKRRPPAAPTVSFSASPATLKAGETSVLAWATQNASFVSITSLGAVTSSGSSTVQPTQTTTYRLTATGAGGTVVKDVIVTFATGPVVVPTVLLDAVVPGGVTHATIANGPASRADWVALYCPTSSPDSNYLAWKYLNNTDVVPSVGLKNATVALDVPASVAGACHARFFQHDTYTRLATSADVAVSTPQSAPVVTFSASPTSVGPGASGSSATLTWSTQNATSVSISPIGTVALAGSQIVQPTATTTYRLTAVGPGGTVTKDVTVTFAMIPPVVIRGILTFTMSPDHATVTSYAAQVRAAGGSTVVVLLIPLGKPTPVGSTITVDIKSTLNTLAAGNYELSVAATNPSGTTDSFPTESNIFTVPLT